MAIEKGVELLFLNKQRSRTDSNPLLFELVIKRHRHWKVTWKDWLLCWKQISIPTKARFFASCQNAQFRCLKNVPSIAL